MLPILLCFQFHLFHIFLFIFVVFSSLYMSLRYWHKDTCSLRKSCFISVYPEKKVEWKVLAIEENTNCIEWTKCGGDEQLSYNCRSYKEFWWKKNNKFNGKWIIIKKYIYKRETVEWCAKNILTTVNDIRWKKCSVLSS